MEELQPETRWRGWKILGTAVLGAGLAFTVLTILLNIDGPKDALKTGNAIWFLVSGTAAAPTLLLLWYWRDKHRHRGLLIREAAAIDKRFTDARDQFDPNAETNKVLRARAVPKLLALACEEPRFRVEIKQILGNMGYSIDGGQTNRSHHVDGQVAQAATQFLGVWEEKVGE